jgi:TatD DNase family protein
MILSDTHTHLYIPEMREQIGALMHRAQQNRVQKFYLPNIDSNSLNDVFSLCDLYPNTCFPMMGLHPCSVKENFEEELSFIEKYIDDNRVIAIGEIGIDLYWDKTFLEQQKVAFRKQIHWAKERKLPIVIHCREAFDEIYEILIEEKDELLRGIFHCFTGNLEQANKIIELGFYLGIGGVLTYKNSGLTEVIKDIDLQHIVLETDSPYLSPVPYRGKPNESSYLLHIAEKLSDVKNCSLEQIANITSENAIKIFSV